LLESGRARRTDPRRNTPSAGAAMTEAPAITGSLLLVAIAVYQAALACGAPWGEPAFSLHPETGDKVLSPGFRVVSGVSAGLVLAAAWVVAAHGGIVGAAGLPNGLHVGLTWFIATYLVVDAVVNLGSASAMKRWLGGAAKVAVALCCVVVAVMPG
jgi:hypothetical protein